MAAEYVFYTVNERPVIQDNMVYLKNIIDGSIESVNLDSEMDKLIKQTFEDGNGGKDTTGLAEQNIDESTATLASPSTSGTSNLKWSHETTLQLINLKKKYEPQFISTTVKNDSVWEKISNELPGFTKNQVKDRWQYLRKQYIKRKENMSDKASGSDLFKFPYFDEMDEILGRKPNIIPKNLASSIKGVQSDSMELSSEDVLEDPVEPPKKKRVLSKISSKQNDALTSSLKEFREYSLKKEEAREKRHRELVDLKAQALNVFGEKMDRLIDKL